MEWITLKENDYYQINRKGQIRRLPNCSPGTFTSKIHFVKPSLLPNGYLKVSLSRNGFILNRSIHRLLALYFIPNPDNKPCVNHKNGIRTDNRLSNLEWCTYSENSKHGYDCNGRIHSGNKKVINTKTGKVFDSITIAAKHEKMKMPTLSAQIIRGIGNYKSYKP